MTTIKLGHVKRVLGKDKVYYDPGFARSTKCWSKADKNDYLQSVFNYRALTPIVLADIKACLGYAEEWSCSASLLRYQSLLGKNYDYVGLDGGNRSDLLYDFFNNKITFSGTVSNSLNEKVEFSNTFWKDIAEEHRPLFTEKTLPVVKVEDALYHELSEIFLKLQRGEPLNPHEKRQALVTPASEWIRDLVAANQAGLSRLFKPESMNRLDSDEFLAKVAMVVIREYKRKFQVPCALKKSDIDAFYLLGDKAASFDDKHSYSMDEIDRAAQIINRLCTLFEKIGSKTKLVTRTAWFSVFCIEYLYDSSLEIKDYNSFWDFILGLEADLIEGSQQQWLKAQNDAIKAGQNPADADFQKKKVNYYFHWTARTVVPADRGKLQEAIQKALQEQIKEQGYSNCSLISVQNTQQEAA